MRKSLRVSEQVRHKPGSSGMKEKIQTVREVYQKQDRFLAFFGSGGGPYSNSIFSKHPS